MITSLKLEFKNLLLQTKAKVIELFDQNVWINVIATGHQIPIIKLIRDQNNMLSIDNFSKRWKCLIYNKDLEFELFFPWKLLQYRCSFSTCLPIINKLWIIHFEKSNILRKFQNFPSHKNIYFLWFYFFFGKFQHF